MKMLKKLFFSVLVLCTANSFAQTNFTYTPEHPQAGEAITLNYTPANELTGIKGIVEGVVFTAGSNGTKAHDMLLKKSGNQYLGTVQTDTSDNFVFFAFSAEGIYDKANNDGFWIQLYDGDKLKKGANLSLSAFYGNFNRAVGIENADVNKALEAMNEEFKLYPDSKSENLTSYLRTLLQVKKEEAPSIIQKEIEDYVKMVLKTETDYNKLLSLYSLAKLPAQANFIYGVIKEKFPNGKWIVNETAQKFRAEKDLDKKEKMLDDILSQIKTNPDWTQSILINLATAYAAKNDLEGVKSVVKKYSIKGEALAQLYNSIAWKLQEKGDNLKDADAFSEKATTWAKVEWEKPTEEKPAMQNEKAWGKARARTYAMYADTYAMVQYKLGNYKKGLPYAEDAALEITMGESADQNNTYALLASKALPAKKYIPQLEKFVKEGKATSKIKEILKESYVRKNGEAGLVKYMARLEEKSLTKMQDELRKSMLNDTVTGFTLVDLGGNKVSSADLKNKVVIVDFWATWCGPCKASFPGMQKMVTKYKNDPLVKFVFIDTWENVGNKEKNAGDFITQNNYDFHVLMDNDNKVVEQFNVSGIPTKFVLDKNGNIRFKSVGFSGSEDKLINELSLMIDMAKEG